MKRGVTCNYGSISNGVTCDGKTSINIKSMIKISLLKVCGDSSSMPNIKIVGGIPAIPNSWPAQILITITISGVYYIPSFGNYNVKQSYQCGGTLIDRATVLTAAHCILDTIDVQIGSRTYTINILNPFDPTQYTVYVGLNSIAFLNTGYSPPAPGVKIAVKSVIRVNHKFNSQVSMLTKR